ncbi:DUF1217 domain-containing protein [Fulvimarina sp. 2208YS6-2-32]|uniref:DUF1217 domain-containing protein n=1 Tax=Fulvimarina uroteuthidis TaxID=3098149 RepID=A0ABU5I311_9HYPH|nr:DUF1217 domain-containing protein [Fulvimarina sp. 2208YS6-2-32]MDY8109744.1 DUF1217 domain-containing protein [Fulvimarina sp. 2208YS6-2-32]
MMSTLQTFQMYTRNTARIMERIEADPINKRSVEYYRENIAKVKTVDDFMSDYRLYSHALTAFGLSEQIGSPGLIRKVLESDMSQPLSLVNKMGDDRYRELHKAFNFGRKGETATIAAQSASQNDRTVEAYSVHRISAANAAKGQLDQYRKAIGDIADVDQFLDSKSVYETALTAAGLDPKIASKDFIRDVFTTDIADEVAEGGDKRFLKLKAMFNFQADGTAAATGVQSAIETNETLRMFYEQKDLVASASSATNDIDYWKLRIPEIKTADQFTQDPRLMEVALYSVGIDASIQSTAFVWQVLTSDVNDSGSVLNQMSEKSDADKALKEKYREFHALFQFETDGTLKAGATGPVAADDEGRLFSTYLDRNADRTASSDRVAKALYNVSISNIKTVSQFALIPHVYEYALKAFGIDPATTSRTEILNVLRSDPGDPKSYARKSGNEGFVALAAAFNFDENGKIAARRVAQSDPAFADTIERYSKNYREKPTENDKLQIKKITSEYRDAIAEIVTISDLVSNEAIVDYITTAFDLGDFKLDAKTLSGILTSDFDDPESVMAKFDDQRIFDLRAAFQFTNVGGLARAEPNAQSKADRIRVDNLFLRQKYEEQAGLESDGARLALYFKRSAADIRNAFDILADPALLKVVQIATGIPSESGQSTIEAQSRTIEKRLDFESLKDPDELSRFINRFVALYDIENGGGAGSINPATILLGGGGGSLGMF